MLLNSLQRSAEADGTILRTLSEQAQLVPSSGQVTGFSVVVVVVVNVVVVVGFAVVVVTGAGGSVVKMQASAKTRRKGEIDISLLIIFLV